ncbi:hypothetical protein E2C01_065636 [Portunus trituberculatus]|uniref:Uncharacterized protein n=1 Tax=Portunus trituberculatus TaxID=210409 RepID=A0A5B7HG37_PORTR|nr:hypothetical protein [Portunus trituberculatus]
MEIEGVAATQSPQSRLLLKGVDANIGRTLRRGHSQRRLRHPVDLYLRRPVTRKHVEPRWRWQGGW